jgi:zinc protease
MPLPAGLSPTRVLLPNGAVVLAKETRKTPAVTINVAIRSGAIADPRDAPGSMHLLSRTIDRGTATRSTAEISDALDDRGVSLNVGVTRHLVSIACTCLTADFEDIMRIVADIVMNPSFPEEELAIRKREVVTAIAQDYDSPYVRAAEELMALLYGADHPYGWRMKGSADRIERVSRDDLRQLHARWFAPSQLMVIAVGDVSASKVSDIVSREFGGWRAATPQPVTLPRPSASTSRRRAVIPMMNKAQADIAYGFVAIARSDPSFYASWLMNNVLGQYALGGRLGDRIREQQGMAYYVSSNLEAQIVEGPLFVRAGVSATNVDRAVASIDEELQRMRAEGVTEREFAESRNFLIASMPRTLETNAGIANFLQRSEVFGLGLDFDLRMRDLFEALRIEEVNQAAAALLDPSRATVVIAGPYQDA